MKITNQDRLLVTGATGLVGSHVAEQAIKQGVRTRALVRPSSDTQLLDDWGVELCIGNLNDVESLKAAVKDVSIIIHCAAKVGDWGAVEAYRHVNVEGLSNLLSAAMATGNLKRFVHVSSLGVYAARDHYGTDETEPTNSLGIDGYTLTKVEAEQVVLDAIQQHALPATILRPGFIYGPRDRTVLPRILEKLKNGGFKFLGSGEQLSNNTFVGNLVAAIFAAIANDVSIGETYNITDGQLVTKQEFIHVIADAAGYPVPTKKVPLGFAKVLAKVLERIWIALNKQEAPILSSARIKFLGLNLDFCIDKAKRELNYNPTVSYNTGMQQTIDWFRNEGKL